MENKFDVRGYENIVSRTHIKKWTFFSDVPQEVAAAEMAGMKGYVVVREGNKPLSDTEKAQFDILTDGLLEVSQTLKTKKKR